MHPLFIVSGLASIGWGLMIMTAAKGGIHEVYGAVCIVGGLIVTALGCLMLQLVGTTKSGDRLWKRAEPEQKQPAADPAEAERHARPFTKIRG